MGHTRRMASNHGITKAELRFNTDMDHIAHRADAFQEKTNRLLRNAYDALKSWNDLSGGCDHDAGICACKEIALLDAILDHLVAADRRAEAAIALATEENAK